MLCGMVFTCDVCAVPCHAAHVRSLAIEARPCYATATHEFCSVYGVMAVLCAESRTAALTWCGVPCGVKLGNVPRTCSENACECERFGWKRSIQKGCAEDPTELSRHDRERDEVEVRQKLCNDRMHCNESGRCESEERQVGALLEDYGSTLL